METGIDLQHRTATCGELDTGQENCEVILTGWIHRIRDHGGVVFLDLRDRYGLTQVVFHAERSPQSYQRAKELRPETVVGIAGTVVRRGPENVNKALPTGKIEVKANRIEIFNHSETLPFPLEGQDLAGEELRLKYRYLDLRRPAYQKIFSLRHRVTLAIRNYLDALKFLEIETPTLTKSTPEGSREYLVPSRVNPGRFYSLPQSPQLFKQILMIAGFDRYFQLARCYRDEDLRSDRQPEFTQIDMEMAFVSPEQLFEILEGLMEMVFRTVGQEIQPPYLRIDFEEAMQRYGTDKPDLRFGMEIHDLTSLATGSEWPEMRQAVEQGKSVRGIAVEGKAGLSRKQVDELVEFCRERGASRLFWLPWKEEGLQGPLVRKLGEAGARGILERVGARQGDGFLFVAEEGRLASRVLGALRLELAEQWNLRKGKTGRMLWVLNFPLFERSEESGGLTACHHPFTAPHPDDIPKLKTAPETVRARAYDLVLDGEEIGGGSIRIHDRQVQETIFGILGISPQQAEHKFGFLLQALQFGAPPHGGIALGLDRIIAILSGAKSLREVIAFPKTSRACCLMTGSPSRVDPAQLEELHVIVKPTRKGPG